MPIFRIPPKTAHILPGCYVGQVISVAIETAQSTGNPLIKLGLQLWPGGSRIVTRLVFLPKAAWVAAAFCESAGLQLPESMEADINLSADDCFGRIVYVWVKDRETPEGDTFSTVHRWLTREVALKKAPELAKIPLPKNAPPPRKLVTTAPVKAAAPANDGPPDDLYDGDEEEKLELDANGYPKGYQPDEE